MIPQGVKHWHVACRCRRSTGDKAVEWMEQVLDVQYVGKLVGQE